MSQPTFDSASHEIWYADGGAGFYVLKVDNSVWPQSTPAPRAGCPAASAGWPPAGLRRLAGGSLGPVTLGMTRARVRRAFVHSSDHGRRYMDFFCLTPIGIRVAYPSQDLLSQLSPATRARLQGKAELALTANQHYALNGVRPGTRPAEVSRRLHVGRGFHIGLNTWYLTPGGASRGVLKVRHGVIEESASSMRHGPPAAPLRVGFSTASPDPSRATGFGRPRYGWSPEHEYVEA